VIIIELATTIKCENCVEHETATLALIVSLNQSSSSALYLSGSLHPAATVEARLPLLL